MCSDCGKINEIKIPKLKDNTKICIEHRFEFNGLKIADVAY